MPENWSVDEENPWLTRKLIPSTGATTHPDLRMHLSIKDMERMKGRSGYDLSLMSLEEVKRNA